MIDYPERGRVAALPVLFLAVGVYLEAQSRDVGLRGVLVAAGLGALGPVAYFLSGRGRATSSNGALRSP